MRGREECWASRGRRFFARVHRGAGLRGVRGAGRPAAMGRHGGTRRSLLAGPARTGGLRCCSEDGRPFYDFDPGEGRGDVHLVRRGPLRGALCPLPQKVGGGLAGDGPRPKIRSLSSGYDSRLALPVGCRLNAVVRERDDIRLPKEGQENDGQGSERVPLRPDRWRGTGRLAIGTRRVVALRDRGHGRLRPNIRVPMWPVPPVTMQTFAVLTIGAVYGARLGLVTLAGLSRFLARSGFRSSPGRAGGSPIWRATGRLSGGRLRCPSAGVVGALGGARGRWDSVGAGHWSARL